MSPLSSSVLPMDVLLEISVRSDPVTLVCCAAACKDLRREIANPAFHPRLRLRRADVFPTPSALQNRPPSCSVPSCWIMTASSSSTTPS